MEMSQFLENKKQFKSRKNVLNSVNKNGNSLANVHEKFKNDKEIVQQLHKIIFHFNTPVKNSEMTRIHVGPPQKI
jgi:hypothetical protein